MESKKTWTIEEGIKKGFLKNKKVALKPIDGKDLTLIKSSSNSIHSFMYDGAMFERCLPISDKGYYFNPFESPEEKEFFESVIGIDLTPNSNDPNCVWNTGKSNLTRVKFEVDASIKLNGYMLDLSIPEDMIKYKILKMWHDIAPSWEQRLDKQHYVWALKDGEYEDTSKKTAAEVLTKCYTEFGKLQSNIDRMVEFLRLYHLSKKDFIEVPKNITSNRLVQDIDEIISKDKKGFLAIIDDPDKKYKILLLNGVTAGAITKNGVDSYNLPGGSKYTMEEMISYLALAEKNKDKDDTYLILLERIDLANGVYNPIGKSTSKKVEAE